MPISLLALLGSLGALLGLSGGGSSSDGGDRGSDVENDGNGPEASDVVDPSPISSAFTVPPTSASAPPSTDWDGPTDEEQMMVELINRARLDPEGEAANQGIPLTVDVTDGSKEVLAITPELSVAARDHSEDMDNRDFFAHRNLDGQDPDDRVIEAGHGSGYVGENLSWIGSSYTGFDTQTRIENHHDNLWASPGHQTNMLRDGWNEVGVGNDYGSYRGYEGSSFITEKFSNRGEDYLTGVVIDDEDGDDFYDIGEGLGGVRITAYKDDEEYSTSTWDSGGYSLALDPGTYRVVFEGGGLDNPFETNVTMGNKNVKLDVIESGTDIEMALARGYVSDTAESSDTAAWVAEEDGDVLLSDILPDTGEPGWEEHLPEVTPEDDAEAYSFF
ncbi:MAG: CAP domain-containing protein [Pseudomonadota bacterium]